MISADPHHPWTVWSFRRTIPYTGPVYEYHSEEISQHLLFELYNFRGILLFEYKICTTRHSMVN